MKSYQNLNTETFHLLVKLISTISALLAVFLPRLPKLRAHSIKINKTLANRADHWIFISRSKQTIWLVGCVRSRGLNPLGERSSHYYVFLFRNFLSDLGGTFGALFYWYVRSFKLFNILIVLTFDEEIFKDLNSHIVYLVLLRGQKQRQGLTWIFFYSEKNECFHCRNITIPTIEGRSDH